MPAHGGGGQSGVHQAAADCRAQWHHDHAAQEGRLPCQVSGACFQQYDCAGEYGKCAIVGMHSSFTTTAKKNKQQRQQQ